MTVRVRRSVFPSHCLSGDLGGAEAFREHWFSVKNFKLLPCYLQRSKSSVTSSTHGCDASLDIQIRNFAAFELRPVITGCIY